jgi:hypothetical protein
MDTKIIVIAYMKVFWFFTRTNIYALVLINIKYGSLTSGPENKTFKNIKTLRLFDVFVHLIAS